ncbi:MAG: protein-export rane protein SecD, partial [Marmoricola sp.]|nr:protein-export rane protein SecD [Marmoricola sp.]
MAKKQLRPGRTLAILGLVVIVLYGLAALGGTFTPRLGLDLEGGTRITLSATAQGGAVTQAKLKEAASIVDARVNGTGVTEAEVTTQGDRNIVVEIPGRNASNLVDQVKRTAQLRFRLVSIGSPQPGTPASSKSANPSPSGSASSSATPSATPSGSASPSSSASPDKVSPSKSASGNPRPAPFARASSTPSPSAASSTAAAASPSAAPTGAAQQAPQLTAKGASVNNPIAWAQDPGETWLKKLQDYQCPTGKDAGKQVTDDPNQPLVTCDSKGLKFLLSKAVIEGTSLKTASYGTPPTGGGFVVNLSLKGSAVDTFGTISRTLNANNGTFAIVLDGQVISYAGFNEPILDGNAQISGQFSESEASGLANSLKFGALPLKFDSTTETIGPSLAGNQLSAGILAGAIGLGIVMLYCLLYYRGLGLVVIASLVVAGAVTYAVVLVLAKAAGFTLTLPGIAGLIVAVGITADSFIVYFERIRDDMRAGRSMRVAVETGWAKARNTCLAADTISLLAAVVLYIFAIGVVRGFAFALGISTIIDVAVFFFFTKPTMTLLARRTFFNSGHRLSGLSSETLGVDSLNTG